MQATIRVFQDTVAFFASLIKPSFKSVTDNRGLFALSVVLAFTIWIFVTDAENPTRTSRLPIDIPVEAVNVGDDVAVAADIQPVRVEVTVAEEVIDDLEAGDFLATVDLTGYGVGTHEEVAVEVEALETRGGLRIVAIDPPVVAVQLAQLTSKSVPVDIVVSGNLPPGYSMGSPEHQATVLVTGPQIEVDTVAMASATIDVGSRTEDVDGAVRLSPRTDRGFLVQRVNLNPEFVDVTIDVEQEEFTRSVAIRVVTEGAPAEGYNLAAIEVNPPTLVVRGDESFIDEAFAINTQPIDVEGADSDIRQSVSLDLPAGVTVPGGAPVVTVSIDIQASQAEFSFTVPVVATNLGEGLVIQGGVPTVRVVLQGAFPVVSAVEVADLTASIDLANLGAGTHTVNVNVASVPGVDVARPQPTTVQVILEQN